MASDKICDVCASYLTKTAYRDIDEWYLHLGCPNHCNDPEEVEWGKDWPEKVSAQFLREQGFEII